VIKLNHYVDPVATRVSFMRELPSFLHVGNHILQNQAHLTDHYRGRIALIMTLMSQDMKASMQHTKKALLIISLRLLTIHQVKFPIVGRGTTGFRKDCPIRVDTIGRKVAEPVSYSPVHGISVL